MSFGETITNLRKAKGITQEQLAEQLGVTRQTISKWELDQSTPDLDYIIRLSDLFEMSTDYLIKGEKPNKEEQAIKQTEIVKEVVYVDSKEKTTDTLLSSRVVAGIIVALLGGIFTITCVIPGIILLIVGVEMILVKKHLGLKVLWTFWIFCTLIIGTITLSCTLKVEKDDVVSVENDKYVDSEYRDDGNESENEMQILPLIILLTLHMIYTLALIIATIRCIRKSKK